MDNFFVTLQVRISKIRAGRKTPGLAAQHLESFKLAFASVPGKLLASFA
jgi:RNA 3'-terminal phosphate cyclase